MKHIGFDDSEVLREYARIAGEKGLVKEAAGGMPNVNAEVKQILKAQSTGGTLQRLSQWINAQPMESRKSPQMAQQFNQTVSGIYDTLLGKYPNFKPALDQFKTQAAGILQRTQEVTPAQPAAEDGATTASLFYDLEKSAKDDSGQYYDVSGETGEQLVEKAHPGGGTKTELTHSKTDENLVETIVEQQKKDVEVATSVPKGTYAALIQLADRLDKMGNRNAADRVDAILKKKVGSQIHSLAQGLTQQKYDEYSKKLGDVLINSVVNNLPGGATSGGQKAVLQGLRGKDYFDVYNEGLRLVNTQPDMRGAWNKGLAYIANTNGPVLDSLVQYKQQQQQPAAQQAPAPTAPVETEQAPGVAKTGPAKKKPSSRLLAMQNELRAALGLEPVEQKPYNPEFKKTIRTKAPRTWNYWKKTPRARIKDLIDSVKKELAGAAKQGPGKVEPTDAYAKGLNLLEQRYPRLKGKIKGTGDEWRNVRQQAWEMARNGESPESISEMFDVATMRKLRRGMAPPATTQAPRMGR